MRSGCCRIDRSLPRAVIAACARPDRQLEEACHDRERFDGSSSAAGMAGSAAALTLAQRGLKVLQLERGGIFGIEETFKGRFFTPICWRS